MRPRGALEILEEALGLLREAPPAAWAAYLTGAIPFSLALLFFFTEMLRSPFAAERLAEESFAVALLYLWKHAWQAVFAARMHQELSPRQDSKRSGVARMVAIQCAVQPMRLVLVPLSLLATVPFAAVVAFFRTLGLFTALGEPDPVASARRMASLWMRQNWAILTFITLAFLLLFLNVFILLIGLPALLRSVAGAENDLTRLGAAGLANLTTAAVAACIAWLAIDPLLTAAYVLRCFYGASVATGEDLTAALRKALGVAAMTLVLFGGAVPQAHAQPAPESNTTEVQRLDQAIDHTIRQPEFAWRSPEPLRDDPHPRWTSWLREAASAIGRAVEWLVKTVVNWLTPTPQTQSQPPSSSLRSALKIWTGAVGVVLVCAAAFFLLRRRGKTVKAAAVQLAAAPAANLEDESLTADRLPESSWRKLAEDALNRGEYRLALRALYLAGLNYMNQRELISVRRWKSGLDYRRELERRLRARPGSSANLAPAFERNVANFERGWYGRHTVDRTQVEALLAGLEEVRRYAENA